MHTRHAVFTLALLLGVTVSAAQHAQDLRRGATEAAGLVRATDLANFSAVPMILIGTAAIASYIPALRATRVDPVVTLRDE